MRTDGSGVDQVPVVARYLAAVGDPDGAVAVAGGEGGGESVGGRSDSGDDGDVDAGEGRRRGGGLEAGLDAVVEGFVGELLLGESAGGGGEAVGAEEGEEDGEDFGIAVDEDGVRVAGGAMGEGGEEGVGAAGAEGGDGGLEELAADVELDTVVGVTVGGRSSLGVWVRHEWICRVEEREVEFRRVFASLVGQSELGLKLILNSVK